MNGYTDEELVSGLVLPAAERNRREGITGCLWIGRHSFVLVIEGAPAAVGALMARIVNDQRHTKLRVLMDCAAYSRLFDKWDLKVVCADGTVESKRIDELSRAVADRVPRPPVAPPEPPAAESKENVGTGREGKTAEFQRVSCGQSRMAQVVMAMIAAEPGLP